MLFLGIDQHARQLTVSLRDQSGDVLLARQVSTQPEKVLEFFDQLTRRCAQLGEQFIAVVEVCGSNDWLIRMLRDYWCHKVILIQPEERKRCKTDRRDAAALSELLWVIRGFKEMYVLVWLCMTTREIIVSESTQHPNSAWATEQTGRFLDQTLSREETPSIVMHDQDTKFTKEFVEKLKQHGVRTNKLPKASPNLNGRCERAIFTLKNECLRRFIIFGKRHLDHLLTEFTEYYNTTRSSMVRDHLPPVRSEPEPVETGRIDQIRVKSYVGGLVQGFERTAA